MNMDLLSQFMCLFNMISIPFPFSLVYVSIYVYRYVFLSWGRGRKLSPVSLETLQGAVSNRKSLIITKLPSCICYADNPSSH